MAQQRGLELARAANQPWTETLLTVYGPIFLTKGGGNGQLSFTLRMLHEAVEQIDVPRKRCASWLLTSMREHIRLYRLNAERLLQSVEAMAGGAYPDHFPIPAFSYDEMHQDHSIAAMARHLGLEGVVDEMLKTPEARASCGW
jgi:hypothetical protein